MFAWKDENKLKRGRDSPFLLNQSSPFVRQHGQSIIRAFTNSNKSLSPHSTKADFVHQAMREKCVLLAGLLPYLGTYLFAYYLICGSLPRVKLESNCAIVMNGTTTTTTLKNGHFCCWCCSDYVLKHFLQEEQPSRAKKVLKYCARIRVLLPLLDKSQWKAFDAKVNKRVKLDQPKTDRGST